ncbi:MAG: SRPBCC family protein [Gemmatimonadaceae bacterium]
MFNAWADPAAKGRWFAGPDDWQSAGKHELDFRVGGRERVAGGPPGGPVHTYEARYHDIVPNERIVSSYDIYMDEMRISVSLATVELKPAGAGTRLVYTEQGVFLDGCDVPAQREHGTRELLDALDAELRCEPARA